MATRDYLNDLIKNFNTQNLISLFYELSSDFAQLEEEIDNINIPHFQVPLLVGSLLVGLDKLCVVSSKLDIQLTERSSKKAQFDFARKFLKNELTYSGGFFVFYDEFGNFRFSFIHKEITKAGREEYSNFKRYTYFVEKDKPNKTFRAQLTGIKFTNIYEIKQAFSLEYVTKLFYEEIAVLFSYLVGGDRVIHGKKTTFSGVLKYPTGENTDKREFAVRLIGRLLFSWFLKKKKSIQGNPLVSDEILSSKSVIENKNFYHSILEVLFFEIFNTENRKSEFNQKRWNDIPFLNGGLFEPIHKDFYKRNEITNFSEFHNTLVVPDEWILELIELFEQYNFTIDESSTSDMDLAIDPEMLGRIFENLLAEINEETEITARKATGSFYTPREIVEFMVSESLIAYLKTKLSDTDDAENKLRVLLSNSDETHKFTEDEVYDIIDALDNMKILDPACGSGAFPMGIVHKVQNILEKVDENGKLWLEKVLYGIKDISFKKTLQHKLQNQPDLVNYSRKLGIIQKTIYGVDIQEIAVEISRLRCFLTIVVDEKVDENERNKGIAALPNLDFKFIAANTLKSINIFLIGNQLFLTTMKEVADKLAKIRDEYFDTSFREKDKLKEEFLLQINKIKSFVLQNKIIDSTRYELLKLSEWNPFAHQKTDWFDPEWMFGIKNGFDIVIGNPPYIKEYTNRKAFDGLHSSSCYQGKMDIWYLFGCKGFELLKKNSGLLIFIATNNWITNAGASKFRNKVIQDSKIEKLIDFGSYMIFENASIQTMIMMFRNVANADNYTFDYRRLKGEKIKFSDVINILNFKNHEFTEYLNPKISKKILKDKVLTFSKSSFEDILDKISAKANFILTENEVANGIHPHYDYVSKTTQKVLGDNFKVGQGIFVLSDDEKKDLNLNKNELELIKPYYTTNQIHRWYGNSKNQEWIIYTDSKFKYSENIKPYPNIKKHLDKFQSVITSDNKPYGLHRAREEWFFKGEKIIVLRKCSNQPIFTYTDFDCYVSATFYVIKSEKINLKYLTAILNSRLIEFWLRNKGKMQGNNYQLDKEPLLVIPIYKTEKEESQQPFIELVDKILAKKNASASSATDTTAEERAIDQMVYKLYELTEEEIKVVENV